MLRFLLLAIILIVLVQYAFGLLAFAMHLIIPAVLILALIYLLGTFLAEVFDKED